MGINYRQKTISEFKYLFSRSDYRFEPTLDAPLVHGEMKKHFKINDDKIAKFLGKYETGDDHAAYRNPFWPRIEHIISNLPYHFSRTGLRPPKFIVQDEALQKGHGRRLHEVSGIISQTYGLEVPDNVIASWVKKYHSERIMEGNDGYFFLNPF